MDASRDFFFFFFRTSSARAGGGGGGGRCQTFFFFFADHERDWPPCKVVFFELATNALNVRNNNNNNKSFRSYSQCSHPNLLTDTEGFQQRDELEHIDESFTEARILDIILEGLTDEYEPIRFAAEREPEISLKGIEITMRNMYASYVAHGDGSTFWREKRCQSAMTASSGFKRSCDYCSKPGQTGPVFQTSARVWRETISFERRGKKKLVQFA